VTDDPAPPGPDHRLGVALAFAAAAALAFACVSRSWLYNPRDYRLHEVGFGLRAHYDCSPGGECLRMSNAALVALRKAYADERSHAAASDLPPEARVFADDAADMRVSSVFPVLGWVTLIAIAVAALALAACGALVLTRRRIAWPIMPTTGALLASAVGLVTGCVFAALRPGPAGFVGVHCGFYAFGAGVVAGIAAALMLNRDLRPVDD
jgi:hypothetical protein